MDKDPTRDAILEYLQEHLEATAEEIATKLGLTSAAVRYHLVRLKRTGKVVVVTQLEHRDPGRPALRYRLSALARPNFIEGLARSLLRVRAADDLATAEALWRALAIDLAGPSAPAQTLSKRLAKAIPKLNGMNYQAHWEAGALGPRIHFLNCPYAALQSEFPGLCEMDRLLLEQWTGMPLQQSKSIPSSGHMTARCTFDIRGSQNSSDLTVVLKKQQDS